MAARILVVEDDELLCEQLVETLQEAGYEVASASSGQGALDWASRGEPLDLVVTDVRMAGMDGIAAFATLRESRPHVRGIIMTGYASTEAPRRAVKAGAWDYLYKPFSEVDLLTSVERVLTSDQKVEQHRQHLASKLWEGARLLLLRALGQTVDKLRQRAYWAFYAGVRSRLLERSEALAAYDELERVEGLTELSEADLEREYRGVLTLIEGLKSETVLLYWESPRRPEQTSREQFDRLFGRIARGQLPGHLLSAAPALRSLPEDASEQQRTLYAQIWG